MKRNISPPFYLSQSLIISLQIELLIQSWGIIVLFLLTEIFHLLQVFTVRLVLSINPSFIFVQLFLFLKLFFFLLSINLSLQIVSIIQIVSRMLFLSRINERGSLFNLWERIFLLFATLDSRKLTLLMILVSDLSRLLRLNLDCWNISSMDPKIFNTLLSKIIQTIFTSFSQEFPFIRIGSNLIFGIVSNLVDFAHLMESVPLIIFEHLLL